MENVTVTPGDLGEGSNTFIFELSPEQLESILQSNSEIVEELKCENEALTNLLNETHEEYIEAIGVIKSDLQEAKEQLQSYDFNAGLFTVTMLLGLIVGQLLLMGLFRIKE